MNWCIAKRMGKDASKVTAVLISIFYIVSGFGWLCVYLLPQQHPPTTIWDYFGIGLFCGCLLSLGILAIVFFVGIVGAGLWKWYEDSRNACNPPKITAPKKKKRIRKEMIFGPGIPPRTKRRKR
jgi:hypothetical protein